MSHVMRNPAFCICENKGADQFRSYFREADYSAFVFATQLKQFFFFLNPKCQASSYLLWLHSAVCVGPGRKPRRPVFSQRGSNNTVSASIFEAEVIRMTSVSSLPVYKILISLAYRNRLRARLAP